MCKRLGEITTISSACADVLRSQDLFAVDDLANGVQRLGTAGYYTQIAASNGLKPSYSRAPLALVLRSRKSFGPFRIINSSLIPLLSRCDTQLNNSYGCRIFIVIFIFRNLSSFHFSEQYDASAIPRAFAGRCGRGSIQRHQSDVPGAKMEVLLKVMRDQYRTRP